MSITKIRLEDTMKKRKITLSELARLTEIPKTSMHRYMDDPDSIPLDRLQIIATHLRVDANYLMGWDSDKDVYGDHSLNLKHFEDKPELLSLYNQIYESESLQLLFDSAKDLTPADLESVLIHIQGIRKARGLD